MSILNLNGPSGRAPRSNGAVKVWMGIGLVIAVLGVGSTLASTITISGNNTAEFGQGVQRTVYCGGEKEITVTPISQFLNRAEPTTAPNPEPSESSTPSENPAGSFYLSGIKVSEIPEECSGVNFVFSVYDSKGIQQTPLTITRYGEVEIKTPTVYWVDKKPYSNLNYGGLLSIFRDGRPSDQSPGATLKVNPKDGVFGSFEISFPDGASVTHASINDVGRIVIETQNDVFGQERIDNGGSLINPQG
jgi:hypothetical protein